MVFALRIMLAVTVTAVALLTVANAASARRIAVDDLDYDRIWTPMRFVAAGTTTTCNVTILGHFHSATFAKVIGSLIGLLDHAAVGSCTEGASATLLSESIPWHIRYRSFCGTLPFLTCIVVDYIGFSVRVDPAGASPACLLRSESAQPLPVIIGVSGGRATGATMDETASIDLEDTDFLCSIGGDAELAGTGRVEDLAGNPLLMALVA